jgi:hypothetical protein
MRIASTLVLLGLVFWWASPACAGPWPQPAGHGFVINTFSFVQGDNHAGVPNPASGNGTFRLFDFTPYMEYGLTDTVTVGAAPHLELRQLATSTTTSNTAGVGDIDLFARKTVWSDGSWVIAGQGLIKVPTGYDPNANPALGNDQVDLEPEILVGRGFVVGAWPAFADIGTGYRYRFGSPADEVRLDADFGVHVRPDWMLLLQSFNIIGLRNQRPGGTDFNLATIAISVVHDLNASWAVQLGGLSDVASRNYNRGNGAFVAVWWRF